MHKKPISVRPISVICVLMYISQVKQAKFCFIIYTSFSGITALNRQLAYLKLLSQWHRVLVVFFEDAEMNDTYVLLSALWRSIISTL